MRIKLIDETLNDSLRDLNTGGKYKVINIVLGSHTRKDLPSVTDIGSILYFDELEVTAFI